MSEDGKMIAKSYTVREFKQILINNGYTYSRQRGDHLVYTNGGRNIVITAKEKGFNKMIARRLIKENNLIVA